MASKRRDPNLVKVILVILVLGGITAGVVRIAQAFQEHLDQRVEAAAIENLDRAKALVAEGNIEEAGNLLRPILARVDNPEISPQAYLLQAELDEANGNLDGALESVRTAIERFPGVPDHPRHQLKYARMLERAERPDEALAIYEDIRSNAPPEFRAPALLVLGLRRIAEGETQPAYDLFREAARDADPHSETWFEAVHAYGDINVQCMFSSQPTPESKVYRVQPGDNLISIGIKLNTTQGLLMEANRLENANRLRLNQNLKYTPKDFEIVIERSTLRLYLLDKNGVFNVYRVGLGKPGNDTTVGHYKIGNKEKDPTWFKPGFGAIPAGDPRNELGSRWMPLIPENEGLPSDLGIHGTINPDSVGLYSSMGCPRLLNEEVESLYNLVVRSTPVSVVDTFTPPDARG